MIEARSIVTRIRLATGLVTNARLVAPQALEGNEEIRVSLAPLADVGELIRTGRITHSLVVAAFQLFALDAASR